MSWAPTPHHRHFHSPPSQNRLCPPSAPIDSNFLAHPSHTKRDEPSSSVVLVGGPVWPLRKRAEHLPYAEELRAQGIEYLPVVWSAYGWPHPDTIRVLIVLARCIAQRRGSSDYRSLARRAARIAATIWQRAANMVLSCWPVSHTLAPEGLGI